MIPALLTMRDGKPGGGKGPLVSVNRSLCLSTGNHQTLFVRDGVRRLTPVEFERLQSFPDNWTLVEENTKDTQRYKQMGNAVTVNVIKWIGAQL